MSRLERKQMKFEEVIGFFTMDSWTEKYLRSQPSQTKLLSISLFV
jgi:hypothetical protein